MAHDEHAAPLDRTDAAPPSDGAGAEDHVPERSCILTRAAGPRAGLIRLALGHDGVIAPDIRAKAPGRGAWIGVDRPALEAAIAKGRLRGALCRAFRTQAITVPADLPDRIAAALARATLDRLGLELRAGNALIGSDRIAETARKGRLALLLHAADAAEDGRRKLDQAWRVGQDREGEALRGLVIPATRAILSMALGRDNVVHVGLTAPSSAVRVSETLRRWCGFIGRDEGREPCDDGSQGPSALRSDFESG